MRRSLDLIIICLIFLLGGCSPHHDNSGSFFIPHTSPPPSERYLNASREELIQKINRSYENLKSLKGRAHFTFFDQASGEIQTSQAEIFWKRTGWVRVLAFKELAPIFFTLVSTPKHFWFYVPRYNVVYSGDLNRLNAEGGLEISLDPTLLEKSFLTSPVETKDWVEMEEIEPPYYLMSINRDENGLKILKRKLWIHRKDLSVEKEILYSPQGIPEIEFIRKNYSKDIALSLPRHIEFKRLRERKEVKLELKSVQINTEIPAKQFDYRPPEGVIIERV